jgi:hypothetical protein
MARKPAILELVGGKSQRQRVWEAIRRFSQSAFDRFTVEDISRACKVEYEPVRYTFKGLFAAGYLEMETGSGAAPGGRGVKNVYRLARDNGVECPRVRPNGSEIVQGRGTEAMWAAITVLDGFHAELLAEIAQVRVSTAKAYCALLARAGYLVTVAAGKGLGRGGKPSQWRVSAEHQDKPRAPMITRLKAVYDPNVHAIVWAEGADDAAEAVAAGEVL